MIDIHCHILHGIDDGAHDLAESLAMARHAYQDGIRHIIATPHLNLHYNNIRALVQNKTEILQKAFDQHSIQITLHPGCEIQLKDRRTLYTQVERHEFCFLGPEKRYILLEQRWTDYDPETPEIVAWLLNRGITPIIPHPERHLFFRQQPELITKLVEAGAWTQVSVDSLLGNNNPEALEFANRLIDANHVHTLATDAHNINRKPTLAIGYTYISDRVDKARAEEINARCYGIIDSK
ncbi:MAG: CpsB/CapC family capsule biosynthesis tyrosine phosphatase [Paenibacillaceae bacterium]